MNKYEKRIKSLAPSTYVVLSHIDEMKGQWTGGANLSPQILSRLKHSVLVTSAGASTRIEGSRLSDEEIEKLMRGFTMQKAKDRDVQEVRGYYEVLQLIFNNYKNIELSENTILQLHSELLKYSDKDTRHKGHYKSLENRVEMKDSKGNVIEVLFETTPALLTPKAMQELIEWTRSELDTIQHPLIIIANFVVDFLKIHPFLDGNGRMSRVLTNLLLLRAGYSYTPYVSHEKLIEESKANYYIALRRSQSTFGTEDESISDWTEYFLNITLAHARQAVGLLSIELIEKTLSPNQLLVWQYLGTIVEATPGQIAMITNVARPTVSQSLSRLLDLKLIERIGQGRTTRYRKLAV